MKNKRLIGITLIMISLIGCRKAPQGVLDNMKQYGENDSAYTSNKKYSSVEDLSRKYSFKKNEFRNLMLPKDLDLSSVRGIYEINGVYGGEVFDKKDEILKCFEDFHNAEWKYCKGELDGEYGAEIEDGDKRAYFDKPGYYEYNLSQKWYVSNEGFQKPYKMLENHDEIDKAKIKTKQGPVSVQRYVKTITDLYNSLLYNKTFVPQLHRVLMYKVDKNDVGCFIFEKCYEGVPLDLYCKNLKCENHTVYFDRVTNFLTVYINEDGQLGLCTSDEEIRINKKKRLGKVLNVESAIRIVSDTYSGFSKIKVEELKPVYLVIPHYKKDGKTFYAKKGNRVELRPVYRFLIRNNEKNDVLQNMYFYICVDMQTGEIMSNFDAQSYKPY